MADPLHISQFKFQKESDFQVQLHNSRWSEFSRQAPLQTTQQTKNALPLSQVSTSGPISGCALHKVQFRAASFSKGLWTKATFLRKEW